MIILGAATLVVFVLVALAWRRAHDREIRAGGGARPRPAVVPATRAEILVDGSNVMWWDGDTPKLATLLAVVRRLRAEGFAPGVVFDASAGHRLFGGFRNDAQLAEALGLPRALVLVVPKGQVADRYLLMTARDRGLCVVTRDRFRDWLAEFPEAGQPGRLIRGGYGEKGLWLEEHLLKKARG